MAKRKIDVTIGAKDNASAVFKKVGASTVALGVALGNLAGKMISGVFSWLKAGVADALENEQANYLLALALKRAGDASGEFAKSLGDQINALQGVTGASNTYLAQMATQLSTLGVQNNELGSTMRLLHALEGANIRGESAMRAVTRAMQGDYSALSRYIPALRTATTEVEKWAVINKVATNGLGTQIDNLSTLTGAWKALKTHLGSVKDDIWEVISRGLGLGSMFGDLANSVDNFRNSTGFKSLLDGLEKASTFVRDMMKGLTSGEITIGEGFKFLGEFLLAVFKDGSKLMGDAIKNAIDYALTGRTLSADERRQAEIEKLTKKIDSIKDAPAHKALREGDTPVISNAARNQLRNLHSARTRLINELNEESATSKVLNRAKKQVAAAMERVAENPDVQMDDMRKAVKQASAEFKLAADGAERMAKAAERDAIALEKQEKLIVAKEAADTIIADHDEAIKKARAAEAMAAERVQKAAERRAAAEEQLAGMAQAAVGDIIQQIRDEAQQKKDANKRADEWQKNREKAEKIRERLRLGGHATAHERRLLEVDDRRKAAFREAEDARLAEDLAKFDQEAAKQRLEQAQKERDKVQEDMKDLLETIKDDLKQALTAE